MVPYILCTVLLLLGIYGVIAKKNLVKIVNTLKKRLYDFPRQKGFVKEWELASIGEHGGLVNLIKQKNKKEAVNYIRDVHWSFKVQEKYISKYYTRASAVI